MASEKWIPAAAITSASAEPGVFQVGFTAVPGYDYTVQSSGDLTAPSTWTNTGSLSGGGGVASVGVSNSAAGPLGFYRLARTPSFPAVPSPPSIVFHTLNQSVNAGTKVYLVSIAAGTSPLSYQWQKDGVPLADGGAVSGSRNWLLSLTGVTSNDAGGYALIATNVLGSVTSSVSTLTILSP
jgi:hypothetical protein